MLARSSLSIGVGIIALCALLAYANWSDSEISSGRLWVGERVLWNKILTSEPIPVPYEVSHSGSEGVVVSALVINEEGGVTDVSVIQSPHPALVDALTKSLANWTFSKTTVRGYEVELTGKVIQYLVAENGAESLLTPEEAVARGLKWPRNGNPRVQLVDVRHRADFEKEPSPGAVNVPLDELQVRAPVEFDSNTLVSIDCTRLSYDRCEVARNYLKSEGFLQVDIVGEGRANCEECP